MISPGRLSRNELPADMISLELCLGARGGGARGARGGGGHAVPRCLVARCLDARAGVHVAAAPLPADGGLREAGAAQLAHSHLGEGGEAVADVLVVCGPLEDAVAVFADDQSRLHGQARRPAHRGRRPEVLAHKRARGQLVEEEAGQLVHVVRVVRREKDLVWPLERGHHVARREGDSRRSDLVADLFCDLLLGLDDPSGRQGGLVGAGEGNDDVWRGEGVGPLACPGGCRCLVLPVGRLEVDFEDGARAKLADRARNAGAERIRRAAVGGGGLDAQDEPVSEHLVGLPLERARLELRDVIDLGDAAGDRGVLVVEVPADRLLGDGRGEVVGLRRHDDLEAPDVDVVGAGRRAEVRRGELRG
mmetsp:Transcript_21866/g.72438  ORF Transcript_21866/g.72438 Transcript_21866/m.72438 type:complete len:362 (-) Transcript_21866:385-1470(-)